MIQEIGQSQDNVLGYRVVGDVTKDDDGTLVPEIEAAVKQYGAIRVLFDMSNFTWEKVDAWGSDFGFGKEFKKSIERMALVGHQSWGKHMAKIAQPFYPSRSSGSRMRTRPGPGSRASRSSAACAASNSPAGDSRLLAATQCRRTAAGPVGECRKWMVRALPGGVDSVWSNRR